MRYFFIILFILFSLQGCGTEVIFSKITVSPSNIPVGISKTKQFYATAYDSSNNILSKDFVWSVSGNIGIINTSGLFSAGDTITSGYIIASSEGILGKAFIEITDKGKISGTITNTSGAKLSNIVVYLYEVPTLNATTNSYGKYTISDVPYGTYEVFTKENISYIFSSSESFVQTAETSSVDFKLLDRLSIMNEIISGNPPLVSGNVANNGTTEVSGVVVTYTFYDSDGSVLGSGNQSLGSILGGGTSSFSLVPIFTSGTDYSSYKKVVTASSF